MRYEIRHVTTYRYAQPAAFSQHLLRLPPRDTDTQRVVGSRIAIDPQPESLTTAVDLFGNTEAVATVARTHEALAITATSLVERIDPSPFIVEAGAPWESVRAQATGRGGPPVMEAAPFAYPSAMTAPDGAIAAYAAESLTPGRSYLAAARELTGRIHADFEYSPGVTAADTMPGESFETRSGVCQDFAHVMLACLRAFRLPARYVSGYLRTIPPPGKPRLEGADASHAWVAVWDPVFGWGDFDPTNDCVPALDHVTLAWGRDFRDVSPVSGLVVGSGAHSLGVGVDVIPLGAEAA
ncbi:MAG: transglutaminase N-terminal domain-containing protein [Paracoccaceae bacterium]